MTTEQKVELVEKTWEEYGLRPALTAVELPKSTWYYHRNEKLSYEEKYAAFQPLLEQIARQHPEYGYRRTTKELRKHHQKTINHKVIQRLHRSWELALLRTTRAPRPSALRQIIREANGRANLIADFETIAPFQVAYTDFTELRYANGREKAHLMPILDHASKLVYGWAVGEQANTALALAAWKRAWQTFLDWQIPSEGMIVHHDQDSVYTSYDWTGQLLLKDKVLISYALGGAKDNPEMEAFFSRFKSEGHSLFLDAKTLDELTVVVDRRMNYHNDERLHSSLGYRAPRKFIQQVVSSSVPEVHI
ncbi:MAG: IS3 family transposase [Nitrospirales bacterium]|nr:IS3 family transposase [Nitrospirales bacterium]